MYLCPGCAVPVKGDWDEARWIREGSWWALCETCRKKTSPPSILTPVEQLLAASRRRSAVDSSAVPITLAGGW